MRPILLIPLLLAFIPTLATAQGPSQPLNIVLFLIDDLGWMDLGCQPCFLYFPHYAVHTPLQAKPEVVATSPPTPRRPGPDAPAKHHGAVK